MLTIASHDTENFYSSISEALEASFDEKTPIEDVWLQKYKHNGEEVWEGSFYEPIGHALTNPIELIGIKKILEEEKWSESERDLMSVLESIETMLYPRFQNKEPIEVEVENFTDYYDMYGVRASDFS